MFCNHRGRIKYWTLNLLIVIHSLHSLVTKNTWLIFSKNVIHLTKGTSEKKTNKQTKTQGPSTCIRIFLKTDIFSPFYSLLFTRKRCFRAPKTQVFENVPQSEDFENTGFSFKCGRTKTEFKNTTMSYIIKRTLCKRLYRIYIVLVLLCGWAKTI